MDRYRAAQQRAQESETLASLGKAAAAVAHEMKTPLMAIGGFAQRVRKKAELDAAGQEKLDIIIRETRRLEEMVHNMLDFSRPARLNVTRIELNGLVQEALKTVSRLAEEHEVIVNFQGQWELWVEADRDRIAQVVINLVQNGVQASRPGQKVVVRTALQGARAWSR
jgi:signal transduction histidine kinase